MSTSDAPLLRVVNPDATPEEIAAIVAVFAALGSHPSASGSGAGPVRSRWAAPVDRVRPMHRPGPGAWQANALPR